RYRRDRLPPSPPTRRSSDLDWIARIDRGGGNEPQLYVYDVRNIKASDLARYLAQIYTNAPAGGGGGGEVGPGLSSGTLGNADNADRKSTRLNSSHVKNSYAV